jgi:hypothetical protein
VCVGLHVLYPLFLPDFNTTCFSRQNFEKYTNIKFHEIPSSGSRVVPCGRTNRQTDMRKLIITFCNFAKAPKNCYVPRTTVKEFTVEYRNPGFGLRCKCGVTLCEFSGPLELFRGPWSSVAHMLITASLKA